MRFALLSFLILPAAWAQTWILQQSGATASLRGISVVNRSTAWASGTGGTFLRTTNGGNTWTAAVVPGAEKLDFRGVHAFTVDRAILMSSGEGALSTLYETNDGGRTWTMLFRNPDPRGFFDALVFDGRAHGALLGDPVDGKFALFLTGDGGRTWTRLSLPSALEGEGAFAASNSSLVMSRCRRGNHCEIFFATGGVGAARIFYSPDSVHWNINKTPLRNDGRGAGIFSLALAANHHGVAVGGDYAKPNEAGRVVAITTDSSTWTEPTGIRPRGYRSSVIHLRNPDLWITTGPTGSELSRDMGQSWSAFDDGAFNAIGGVAADACWAVGPKGRIAHLKL